MNTNDREETRTLEILQAIEQNNDVTQRHLASHLGVALGLANSYLKRCVRKGLIKIHQAPANRYLYYLTPKGFAEKSRLTAAYLTYSFDFYRLAGESLAHLYGQCVNQNKTRILFCGASELAEIASIRAHEHEITIIGIFDPDYKKSEFLNLPTWKTLDEVDDFDVCILTQLKNPTELYDLLSKNLDKSRILIPSILDINER